MRQVLLAGLFVIVGCSGSSSSGAGDPPEKQAPSEQPAPTKAGEPGPPERHTGVDELPELEGLTEAEIVERFGEPTRADEYPMSECCNEFQIELYNTYPPKSGHEAVRIHEWTWAYDGYFLTLWLHEQGGQWVVLDTCRYSEDVEF